MYVKLFSSILQSSIWSAPTDTRLVWITLLAMADQDGFVRAAPSGLARTANVTPEACQAAIALLESPDTESGSPEYEGRRIEATEGGWVLLNYAKYRILQDPDVRRAQTRERVARHRERKRSVTVGNAPKRQAEAEAKAEVEAKKKENLPVAPSALGVGVTARKSSGRNGRLPARRYEEITARITALFAETAERGERTMKDDELRELQADMVFAYWAARLNHKGAFLDAKRVNLLKAALKLNRGNVHELLFVVDGTLKDDYLMGRAANSRTKYDGLETIFRDRGQIEKLAAKGGYQDGGTHPQADKYGALVRE